MNNPVGTAAVEVNGLCMRYGTQTAVDSVSFSISKNSTVALLGPNGAGKSTTMRMLAGFSVPSRGTVAIAGHDILDERRQAQASIGYLPETVSGFGHLATVEFLSFCCGARGLRGPRRARAIEKVCEDIDLAPAMGTRLQWLSKGWRQRVWLAQALLHDPKVLILDEPTDGLDPIQKRSIRRLIKQLATTRAAILSTHILEEAEETCDRAIIIEQGRILVDDRIENLLDGKGRIAPLFYSLTTGS